MPDPKPKRTKPKPYLQTLINKQVLLLDHFADPLTSTEPCTLIEIDVESRFFIIEAGGRTFGINMEDAGAITEAESGK